MTSQISFRFKNAISQDQVLFDGSVIQIGDIKRLIAVKRGLGPEGAAELTLFDPNSNDEYTDDGKVIPRNSLVIVKRAPVTKFKPLQSAAPVAAAAASAAPAQPSGNAAPAQPSGNAAQAQPAVAAGDDFGGDYYSDQPQRAVVGEDEDKALQNLLQGTAASWQREVRQGAMRGRGRGRGGRGRAPLDYRCSRCDAVGQHWVQDCPTQGDPNFDRKRIRPPVGIPMTRLAKSEEGGLILPDGQTGTLVANEDAFAREILGLPTAAAAAEPHAAAATAAPTAEADSAAAAQPGDSNQAAPMLLLDNKPHEAKEEPGAATTPTAVPHAGSQLALPHLAGEEELASPAMMMPGAAFFNMFMQSVVMPRGPPEFVMKAFHRDHPLSRSEYEQLQNEYRARYHIPPFHGRGPPATYSPGRPAARPGRRAGSSDARPARSRSPKPQRSSKEGEASRRSRDEEQRGPKDGERSSRSRERRRSRERVEERRRSRDRGEGRRRSSPSARSDRDRGEAGKRSPQRTSRGEDRKLVERRADKDEKFDRHRSRRHEREGEEKARKQGRSRSRDRAGEHDHKRRQRRSKEEEGGAPVEAERWQPEAELSLAPADAAGVAAAQELGEEPARAEQEATQKLSEPPVAAPADGDARPQPSSPSQQAASCGADDAQLLQGNGIASGGDVQVWGGAAAEPQQHEPEPAMAAAPLNQEAEQGDRHHKQKKHKKEKKEKKDKKEKGEKKEKHDKKHKRHKRSRSPEGGSQPEVGREEEEQRAGVVPGRQQAAAGEEEKWGGKEEEAPSGREQQRECGADGERQQGEQEAEELRARRRAAREGPGRGTASEEVAEEEEARLARDRKLGPRLFDRAIVAAMRDKRDRHEEGGKEEEESRKDRKKRSKKR